MKGMGEVVNLRRARKLAKRELDEQRAAANRVQHGRSKADRAQDAAVDDKARRDLDGHRIQSGDDA
jgi:hypothetical protein